MRWVILVLVFAFFWAMYRNSHPYAIGVKDGKLKDCPGTPNCVCSRETKKPFPAHENSILKIRAIIQEMPRTKIVTETSTYLHAEVRSPIFSFVDDVEFLLTHDELHYRSAARMGYSDWHVNANRMATIRMLYMNSNNLLDKK